MADAFKAVDKSDADKLRDILEKDGSKVNAVNKKGTLSAALLCA